LATQSKKMWPRFPAFKKSQMSSINYFQTDKKNQKWCKAAVTNSQVSIKLSNPSNKPSSQSKPSLSALQSKNQKAIKVFLRSRRSRQKKTYTRLRNRNFCSHTKRLRFSSTNWHSVRIQRRRLSLNRRKRNSG